MANSREKGREVRWQELRSIEEKTAPHPTIPDTLYHTINFQKLWQCASSLESIFCLSSMEVHL